MGAHITPEGKWKSDKYPEVPADLVPLKVTDKTAQDLLWEYAQRRRSVDAEFSDDLETRLRAVGYAPVDVEEEMEQWANDLHRASRISMVAPDGTQTVRVVPEGWQPLTEAEAQRWAAVTLHDVGRASEWPPLRCDLTPLREAFLAADRRDIPAEVRVTGEVDVEGFGRLPILDLGSPIEPSGVPVADLARAHLRPEQAREAGRAATRGDADAAGLSAGMTWVAQSLAEAMVEIGEVPDARVDVLVERAVKIILGSRSAEHPRDHVEPEERVTVDAIGRSVDEATALAYGTWSPDAEPKPWSPKAGDPVRTAQTLTSTEFGNVEHQRKVSASGTLLRRMHLGTRPAWWVRHNDGIEAPYEESELLPVSR